MKRKTILRREWKGIHSISYAEERFDRAGYRGIAGLLYMRDADDFYVHPPAGPLKITAKDYSWLHLALENEYAWATVMFDEQGDLFECYFDVTAQNVIKDGGNSYFDDLYLDVVTLSSSDELLLYDEDELLEAYAKGEIDDVLLNRAYESRQRVIDFIRAHKTEFFSFCREERQKLIPNLNEIQ